MAWFILAPNHRIAHQWLRDHHPDVNPHGRDVRIVTPAAPEKLRGCMLRDGDRLIWLNRSWLPNTPGAESLRRNVAFMQSVSGVTGEYVEW